MSSDDHGRQMVELCRTLSARGYLAATGGNVAIRIGAEHFAVTPSAIAVDAMSPAEICMVRLADQVKVGGEGTPSVETGLHANVLTMRPDVWCSIHTHQPVASACALIGKPLPVRGPGLRSLLGPEVPVVGYRPSGTKLLAALLKRSIRPHINAYLMKSHGVLCCGRDVDTAVAAVDALERLSGNILARAIAAEAAAAPRSAPAFEAVLSLLKDHR